MNRISLYIYCIILSIWALSTNAQNTPAEPTPQMAYNAPQAGNPIIPGYFADPTVKKFGDTYYIYATTDGNGGGLGPSQVWVSKDFVNWTIMPMNWPTTHHIWAPDVMQAKDEKYYLYYCEPCQIYCGMSETPRGPWSNILGEEGRVLVPDRFVKNAITLDGQTFTDDDGSIYLYWGTWGIYKGFGCGTGRLSADLKNFDSTRLIVNTEAHDFFEAPFVIKKDGVYYFTYSSGSCHDETYRVQYATSTVGPMGPYQTADNNPILATTEDKTIHGPGHHSILQEGNDYYIIYHRHDIPNSTRGMHRQIAADKLIFGPNHSIQKVAGSHQGIGYLQPSTNPFPNLALGKSIRASSFYNENFRPSYAIDDNNATLWRPKTCGEEWIEIDLDSVQNICRIWTQFEYATSYYQYKTETSIDGKEWQVFADKTNNRIAGSPMVDYGKAKARYVRLTITGNEKNGLSGAIWNIKIFADSREDPPQLLIGLPTETFFPNQTAGNKSAQSASVWRNDYGMLGGKMSSISGEVNTVEMAGRKAIRMKVGSILQSDITMPAAFNKSQAYTLSYKIFATAGQAAQRIAFWSNDHPAETAVKNTRDMATWHDVAWVSDGKILTVYMDGERLYSTKENHAASKDKPSCMEIRSNAYELILTDFRLYNWKQEKSEIQYDATQEMRNDSPASELPHQGILVNISADDYAVGASLQTLNNPTLNSNNLSKDNDTQTSDNENLEISKLAFQAIKGNLNVVLKEGRKAFAFDGNTIFRSNFGLPESMTGNAPYSIEAWILHPEWEDGECIVDLIAANGELEKIAFGNGRNADNGIISHNGSFEDMGIAKAIPSHQWQHWAVTFDGYMEKIYQNGRLIQAKDIVLRLPRSRSICLGSTINGERPFDGYLHSLKAYDRALNEKEIQQAANDSGQSNILLLFAANQYDKSWKNEGSWGGQTSIESNSFIHESALKLALFGQLTIDSIRSTSPTKALIIQFCRLQKISKPVLLIEGNDVSLWLTKNGLRWNGQELTLPTIPLNKWQQIILQQEEENWKIYLDGNAIAELPIASFYAGNTLRIGNASKKSGIAIAKIDLLSTVLSTNAVEEYYDRFQKNDLKNKHFQLQAVALTPSLLRLSATENGEAIPDGKYTYLFKAWKYNATALWTKASQVLKPISDSNITYGLTVQDLYGNVCYDIPSVELNIQAGDFVHFDTLALPSTTLSEKCWDGLLTGTSIEKHTQISVDGNKIIIESSHGNFTRRGEENAPMLYKEVSGNFVMEVRIDDLSGLARRNTPGYNEGGLMVMDDSEGKESQNILHLGVFPLYNCGNMLTEVSAYGRFQSPNNLGWDFHPFMQIERNGDLFYFRTSNDGHHWEDMPNSPISKEDWHGKTLKVGLYQVTYTENKASVTFKDFQLWIRQK